MRRGKISEIALKRSVLKNIKNRNAKVIRGADLSNDACEIQLEDVTVVMSSNCIETWIEGCIEFNIAKGMNNIYVQGGIPFAAEVSIALPLEYEEKQLGKLMRKLDEVFGKYNVQISGGHTTVSANVNQPIIMFTIMGSKCYNVNCLKDVKPGQQIVMTKSIAVGGTGLISNAKTDILKEKFINTYVDKCKDIINYISIEDESRIALECGEVALHDISTGGVFAGVWELTSASGLGVKIELQKIPVWQETIEVSEVFDINPYMLDGTGSLLIVTNNGERLVDVLEEKGINASVIGIITSDKNRVLINGDETRFLEPQRGDEIYKLF